MPQVRQGRPLRAGVSLTGEVSTRISFSFDSTLAGFTQVAAAEGGPASTAAKKAT